MARLYTLRKTLVFATLFLLLFAHYAEAQYCIPVPNANSQSSGNYITSFTTNGGITNIGNTDSGYSSGGYGNFSTTHSVTQYRGETVSFSAVPQSPIQAHSIKIWVDYNHNNTFEESEVAYFPPASFNGPHHDSFTIAPHIPAGSYRMRVILSASPPNTGPCESAVNFFGEAEDYTLTVILPDCPAGDVTFTTQQQIDDFGALYDHCTQITGNLIIGYESGPGESDIIDLAPLENITGVTGNLILRRNPLLTTLDGLQSITSFGGNLRIDNHLLLEDISALSGITSVKYLNVRDNAVLTNLNGLQNITTVTGSGSGSGYVYIRNNSLLTNVDGLQGLTVIGNYIEVLANPLLENLDGLHNVTAINGNITIRDNPLLSDIHGLANINPATIATSGAGITIQDNPNLAVCNLSNFCTYLSGTGARTINGNAGFCLEGEVCILCRKPINLTATDIRLTGADFSWTSVGTAAHYNWAIFASGADPETAAPVASGSAAGTNITVSGLTEKTNYIFYVKAVCGEEDGESVASSYPFTTPGYCIPSFNTGASSSNGIFIRSFTTTGAVSNINNTVSGYSPGGYGNLSATHSVQQYVGESISFSVVPEKQTYEKMVNLWVDYDNNLAFEPSEMVYSSPYPFPGTHNGSFTIPTDIPAGSYRMRVTAGSALLPCPNGAYGEAEDYTLMVLVPGCPPGDLKDNATVTQPLTPGQNHLYDDCTPLAIVAPSGTTGENTITASMTTAGGLIATGNATYLRRYFDISVDHPTAARVTLFFTQADFDHYNNAFGNENNARLPDKLRVARYSGTWSLTGTALSAESAPHFTDPLAISWNETLELWEVVFDTPGFSGFFITGQSDGALPVTLSNFMATAEEQSVLLTWQTVSEVNFSHFEPERSKDGRTWYKLGTVPATGENEAGATYHYRGYTPQAGLTYYRLKMVDRAADRRAAAPQDESYAYSPIKSVIIKAPHTGLVDLYPNPASLSFTIKTSNGEQLSRVELVPASGQPVRQWSEEKLNAPLALDGIPAGIYFVKMYYINGLFRAAKLVVGR